MLYIEAIPAFDDNYFWLLHRGAGGAAAVVDPGLAGPVREALVQRSLSLEWILTTHHHADHVGGVADLAREYRTDVLGPAEARIAGLTRTVADGESVRLDALDLTFDVIAVPGHTRSHIAWYCPAEGVLFCGDALFAAGCGRMFEGDAAQFHASLMRLSALPAATRCYCAHEYTLSNLAFARHVEPDSSAIATRITEVRALRAAGTPSVPFTLADESVTNPFLRASVPAVKARAAQFAGHALQYPHEVFGALRAAKDQFKAPTN